MAIADIVDLPGAQLFLDAFEDDDVRVGRDADREDQSRDAGQGQRDRDQLDQPEEEDRVGEQRDARDRAQQAVEEQQEEQHEREADGAGDQALVQRLLAERRGDLGLADRLQVIGSAPVFRTSARSCASWSLKPPEICAPVRPSMPSGFSR